MRTKKTTASLAALTVQTIVAKADVMQLKARLYVKEHPKQVRTGLIASAIAGTVAIINEVA